MNEREEASKSDSALRTAQLLRARVAFAIVSIASWFVFLGAKSVNDVAGEGTVAVPVAQLALPAAAAFYIVVRHADGIASDAGLRWQTLTVAGLTGLCAVIMAVTADNPAQAVYWSAVITFALSIPLLTRRIAHR